MEKNYEEKLIELNTKSKKKTVSAKKESYLILSKVFVETKNYNEIIDWCIKCHYSVCDMFFDKNIVSFEDAEKFSSAIITNPVFQKKGNYNVLQRLIIVCSHFLKKGTNNTATINIILKAVSYGKTDNGYYTDLVTNFKKYIIDKKLINTFIDVVNIVDKEYDKKRLLGFIAYMEKENSANFSEKKIENKNEDKMPSNNIEKPLKPSDTDTQNYVMKTENEEQILINQFKEYNEVLASQIKKLTETNSIISTLKTAIENSNTALALKENEIKRLHSELSESKEQATVFATENNGLKQELNNNKTEINNLHERLKSVFEIDNSIQNQEIETLKRNITDALRLEHNEFKSSDNVCNEDNFQANYASLHRIFKILNRFGVNFD